MKKYIATNRVPNTTHIKIEVRYGKGGINYFTGKNEPRGVYVSICPVALEDRPEGYRTEMYTAFSGTKFCVKELKRKSDKAVQEVAAKIEPVTEQIARAWEGEGSTGAINVIREALA